MKRVLLVDDEPLLCAELAEGLDLEGFEVEMEHSVSSALNFMDSETFDAIVTDLKMPKIGGLEFIKELKTRGFEGDILVISGHGAESSREEAMALGAKACLAKPVDVDEVIALLD